MDNRYNYNNLEERDFEIDKKLYNNKNCGTKNSCAVVKYIVFSLVLFFLGALIMYGIIFTFPTVFSDYIVQSELEVTVTDEGIADAVDKIYDAVVIVSTYNDSGLISTGSGFVYKVEGDTAYILTNHHVIDEGTSVNVAFTDGSITTVTIEGSNEYEDIAVLSVPAEDIIIAAELGDPDEMRLGDTTFAVGGPLDSEFAWTVTRGILSGVDRMVSVTVDDTDYYMNLIQTDTAINSGNSGGPLCNSNGEVIGITTLKYMDTGVEGMGFAISIDDALEAADNILNSEGYETPYLGIGMYDLSIAYSPMYKEYEVYQEDIELYNLSGGVIITEVTENSSADLGGILEGDIIYSFNGVDINSAARLKYELYNLYVGDVVDVELIRDGVIVNLTFELLSSN